MAIEFCDMAGHYGLVVIDDCSRMLLEADVVHLTAAKDSISQLDPMFAALVVVPISMATKFAQFPYYLGFKHHNVTPL